MNGFGEVQGTIHICIPVAIEGAFVLVAVTASHGSNEGGPRRRPIEKVKADGIKECACIRTVSCVDVCLQRPQSCDHKLRSHRRSPYLWQNA